MRFSSRQAVNFVLQGLGLSAFFAGQTLTQIPGGYLSDRYGGEPVMIASMAGWATLTLIIPLVVKPWSHIGKLYAFAVVLFITGGVQGEIRAVASRRNVHGLLDDIRISVQDAWI